MYIYIYIVGTSYCSDFFFQFSGILQYAWCFTFHISKLSGNSQPKTTASWNIYQAVGYPSRCCWIIYIYIYINFGALWKHYEKHEDIITSVFCLITFIYNDIHTFITFYTYVIYIYIYQKTILLFLSILYHRLASHLVLMTCEFSAAGWPSITRSTPRMRSRFTPAIGRYRANMLWWWNQFEWDLDGT